MAPSEIRGPDLAGVVADANEAGLDHVVIGGFAVIAHGYLRATKDSDLLERANGGLPEDEIPGLDN